MSTIWDEINAAGLADLPASISATGVVTWHATAPLAQRQAFEGLVTTWFDPVARARADLLAYAADRRWRIEVGGIVIAGVPIATDDRSKIMIMGARVAAASDAAWQTIWHGADGQTYPLNAAAMIAISGAVEAHVNATFGTFATVKTAIEAGTITTTAAIDAAFA